MQISQEQEQHLWFIFLVIVSVCVKQYEGVQQKFVGTNEWEINVHELNERNHGNAL